MPRPFRTGELNKRIRILDYTPAATASGAEQPAWNRVFATVWAAIWPARRGRGEFFAEEQAIVATGYIIRIRYLAGVTEKMRIEHASRVFAIREVPVGDRRDVYIDLVCEEVKAAE